MEKQRGEGQILFSAYRWIEGGRLSNLQKKEICLELIVPEDEAILAQKGITALRQARIARLSSRAAEQGAILTYDDLVHLLSTSLSTVKRDVRALQQEGFSVPLYRRRGRRVGGLVVPIVLAIFFSSRAQAQLSSIFGSVGFDYEYENRESDSASTSQQRLRQLYNLGVNGRILDPRLATFFLTGSFNSSLLTEENTRGTSLAGNLSLLQGAPYGLTLRGSKSFSSGGTETEGSTIGANLRLTFPDLPQVFFEFDRSTIESRGEARSDLAITTGKMSFSHNFWSTMLNGEVGVQTSTDGVRNTSRDRYFARLNNTITWSPTTTLRSVNDGFLQGNQLILGSSYSLENRPDPTLRRTAGIEYRSSKSGKEQDHSLSLSGAVSKSFFPYPWLQANTFTSAIAQKSFGSEDPAGFAWSGGSSAAISYFRPVSLLADYALAVSYQTDVAQASTIQQAHVGAVSRTLDPLRLSGDYYFGYQTGLTESTRHFLVGRADAALTPQLSVRSVVDLLYQTINSSEAQSDSTEQTAANIGGGVSYRPLYNLTLDIAGNLRWSGGGGESGTITRADMRVSFFLPRPGTPNLDVNGVWERNNIQDEDRFEVRSRFGYRIGQATLSLEHRFEHRSFQSASEISNAIHLNITRPFSFSY